jgi:hypothetical protein
VLFRLRENSLFVKKEKCEFAYKKILFLGHRINLGKIMMDEGKVKAFEIGCHPSQCQNCGPSLGWPTTTGSSLLPMLNRQLPSLIS